MNRILLLWCSVTLLCAAQPETVSIKVQDQSLLTLLEQVAEACDAHLLARQGLADRLEKPITLMANNIVWGTLVAMLDSQYGITVTLEGKTLSAVDSNEVRMGTLTMRSYDVRPLLREATQYPGPELGIPEPGGRYRCVLAPIADETPPDIAAIAEVIMRLVTPDLWNPEGGITITEVDGNLVITHTPEGQKAVETLLRDLLRVANRQIVCRVYALPAAVVNGPVISADQWKTTGNGAQLLAAFSTLDGQQNHHFSGRQRFFLTDANAVQSTFDPIVSMVSDGLVVDIQPISTLAGVLADIRFSAGAAEASGTADLTTADGTKQMSIDLPQQALDLARDTRLVPPGGAALYRFADRQYAVVFEVLDYAKIPPLGK